jgi:DNA primase large subunit
MPPMPLELPEIGDDSLLARYAFLPQSKDYIKKLLEENNITIEQLIEAPWLEDVRARGRVRLVESITHKGDLKSAEIIDLSTEIGKMTECLSFLHAMLVICASFDERLLGRWIEGESSRADHLLGIDTQNFMLIAKTYLSDIKEEKDISGVSVYWIPMSDFIELCPKISGNYWRLINRSVKNGWVCMDSGVGETSMQRTSRLLKERIRENLNQICVQRMEKMDDEFAAQFSSSVERIVGLFSERVQAEMPISAAKRTEWPPCFELAVSELNQGINVNHTGRVFLASMSRSMGFSQEETLAFFSNAPDYNVETSGYQINQIYEREYTPHGCSSLKTGARCPVQKGDNTLCDQEWMSHPLKYLRAKQRRRYNEDMNQSKDMGGEVGSGTSNSS